MQTSVKPKSLYRNCVVLNSRVPFIISQSTRLTIVSVALIQIPGDVAVGLPFNMHLLS